LLFKKKPQATLSSEHFGRISFKNSSHLEEEASYEITKIFLGGFRQISNFFLLKSPYI
jgi:hypothetical protein